MYKSFVHIKYEGHTHTNTHLNIIYSLIQMYRVRIDVVSGFELDEFIQISESMSHVVVRHELPHGNPHIHAYVQNDIKDNTYRQRIKRKFPMLKASDFSIKTCDASRINEYVQYLFNTKHGNKWEIYDTRNFDNQLLNTLIQNARTISDEYDTKSKAKRKLTVYDLAEIVNEVAQSQILTVNGTYRERYQLYLKTAIAMCHKHRQAFEEHYLKRLVCTAISISDSYRVKMIAKIMEKEFREYET